MERRKGRIVRNLFIESVRVAIAGSMFACTESLLITLNVSYVYMRVVIVYHRIFLLQPVRLRSRLQHKCKKSLDRALCLEMYAVNLYFYVYWLFACVARYLCISSLVIFILF